MNNMLRSFNFFLSSSSEFLTWMTVFKFVEPPENNEKLVDHKSKVKFKIMSLKVKGEMDYVPELVYHTSPLIVIYCWFYVLSTCHVCLIWWNSCRLSWSRSWLTCISIILFIIMKFLGQWPKIFWNVKLSFMYVKFIGSKFPDFFFLHFPKTWYVEMIKKRYKVSGIWSFI